jgi:hypothetical protein
MVAARTHGAAFGVQTAFAFPDLITPASHGCIIMLAITVLLFAMAPDGHLLEASPMSPAGASGEGRILS